MAMLQWSGSCALMWTIFSWAEMIARVFGITRGTPSTTPTSGDPGRPPTLCIVECVRDSSLSLAFSLTKRSTARPSIRSCWNQAGASRNIFQPRTQNGLNFVLYTVDFSGVCTRLDLSTRRLSLCNSPVWRATIATINETNKLVREVVAQKAQVLMLHAFPEDEELVVATWTDGAVANRPDLGSTGGYVVGMTTKQLLQGHEEAVSLISWKSGRVPRVAKSSLSVEVQSCTEGDQEQMFCRLQWAELNGWPVLRQAWQDVVKHVPGVIIIDARACYDAIHKGLACAGSALGLKEKAFGHRAEGVDGVPGGSSDPRAMGACECAAGRCTHEAGGKVSLP